MRLLKRVIIFAIACLLVGAAEREARGQNQDKALPPLDPFSLDQLDQSVDPCTNFYAYTCKKWIAANPIPADEAFWGPDGKLQLWNESVLREVLETSSQNDPNRSPVVQKIGDYYESCMDESGRNAKGIGAIQPELDRINAMQSKADLPAELARIHQITFSLASASDSGYRLAVFGFASSQDLDDATKVVAALDQGGLGLPDRDYYFKDDAKSVETRQQYTAYAQKLFALMGEDPATAGGHAKVVMEMETALAKSSMDLVKRRDPANLDHKLTPQELNALTPSFSWGAYFKPLNPPATVHYLVATPDFLKGANQLIEEQSLENWKTYLRWNLVNVSASRLSDAFVQENFEFYGHKLYGQKELDPLWKRCVRGVDRDLGEALGQAYVERAFGSDAKARMLKLVNELTDAMVVDIQNLDWMTPETKKQALVKLRGIEDKIGYPNHWRDYSSLQIVRDDDAGNIYRASAFEFHRQLEKIGKPVDRGEWGMTPPTVNAYYDPQLNTINFPAGILQPPYFEKSMDDAVNLGEIGAVIGHEMTHGFDDEGRKFDANGNLRDWWTSQDGKEFEKRAQCIDDEYSGFEAVPGVKLNGKLTLGENTADNGGTRIAYMAFEKTLAPEQKTEKLGGLTPEQRFFIAYGESWCGAWTPELLRMVAQTNPHSPNEFRVNGVVSNMPEFQQAFGCKKGQAMVRENACHVW
jgi:endothelin-converting enzyme/putative endopeptidase